MENSKYFFLLTNYCSPWSVRISNGNRMELIPLATSAPMLKPSAICVLLGFLKPSPDTKTGTISIEGFTQGS